MACCRVGGTECSSVCTDLLKEVTIIFIEENVEQVRDVSLHTHPAPLSTGFSRQGCCSGLLCPPPGVLPDPEIQLSSLLLMRWQVGSLLLVPPGKPCVPSSFQTAQHILHSESACPRHLGGSLIVKEGPGREAFNLCL